MNNLLIWPLSENSKIIFRSQDVTLSTITCCDQIDIIFDVDQSHYDVIFGLTECELSFFKQSLEAIIANKINKISFQDTLLISKASLGQILLEIHKDNKALAYFFIDIDTIQAWATQLDLLGVVMQENENEKKSRGKGCC